MEVELKKNVQLGKREITQMNPETDLKFNSGGEFLIYISKQD